MPFLYSCICIFIINYYYCLHESHEREVGLQSDDLGRTRRTNITEQKDYRYAEERILSNVDITAAC